MLDSPRRQGRSQLVP